MRSSVSLTSFFSSIRSSIVLVPIIRIITPTEPPPPRLSTGPCGIRRWRGALGTVGDLALQLPSQGLTSGARLALARQGCATGSFKLNCSESLYVKDERGLAMFQRIELEEELEKGRLGLRERPPMLATSASMTESSSALTLAPSITLEEASYASTVSSNVIGSTGYGIDAIVLHKTSRTTTRRPSMRTQKRNALATQSMRFDSGGLSSCATFTEGLCHLEDYVRASEAPAVLTTVDSTSSTSPTTKTKTKLELLPRTHSEQEISELPLSVSSQTRSLSWLESLRIRKKALSSSSSGDKDKEKRTNKPGAATHAAGVKPRRSAGELVKSLSCIDFDLSFSQSDLTLNINMDSCAASPQNSANLVDGLLKNASAGIDIKKSVEDGVELGLRREGSWTRLRRRISKRYSELHTGASFGTALVSVFQQRMTTNVIRPSVHVAS